MASGSFYLEVRQDSTYPDSGYLDRLGPPSKYYQNSTKLTILEIIGYRIKYSTVLWLLELQIRQGRMVQTQVHTVNRNSRTSNCQSSLFSKKNQIMRIFCMSGWTAVPINLDKRSSTVSAQTKRGPHTVFSKAHVCAQINTFFLQYQHSQTTTSYIRRYAANAHQTWQLGFLRQMCLV